VLQRALVNDGYGKTAQLSFVGSLSMAMLSVAGLANAWIMRTIGTRKSALLGSTFIGFGLVLSAFVYKSLPGLLVCSGIIQGYGFAMCFMVREELS
jgi:uncharacterized protein YqgC (DUF456 family)